MDDSDTYMNANFAKTDARSPSRDGLTSTYSELNFRKDKHLIVDDEDPPIASGPSALPITEPTDGLTSTYSVLNLPKDELHIEEDERPPIASGAISMTAQEADLNSTYSVLNPPNDDHLTEAYEDPPLASGPAEMSVVAQTGPHKQKPKENIGNGPDRKKWLHCLITTVLFVTVVGLSIHVSQIRQSQITCDRNYQELNSTLQSKISENSHLNLSRTTCLKNLSALNSNLSDFNRMHSDLRHKFTEMETKYRSANEIKARICELLTNRRVPACPQGWIENEGRCYFLSILKESYDGAKEHCSIFDARLLKMNSIQEEDFVSTSIGDGYKTYWIGKCRDGKVDSNLLSKSYGWSSCSKCNTDWSTNCKNKHRFICEKSAHLCRDIPEEIRGLCQHLVGKT